MAFNLKAVLRLDDKFSNPMRKVQRQVEQSQKAINQMNRANERLKSSLSNVVDQQQKFKSSLSGFGKLTGGINSVQSAFVGLAGAIGGAVAAKKLFDSTILEAAKYEQSTVVIKAMMDNEQAAKEYMKMIDSFAVDSPIMDSQAMYANSKGFLTTSKDIRQLEKMWDLAERMAAVDPVQGVEGAVFALRELFSGDAVSMVERFEMNRGVMNDIKKMDLPDQLKTLDEYFNKIGMSRKLVEEMGGTTLGLWQQIKESVAVALREMGAPALSRIKTFLQGIVSSRNTIEELNSMKDRMLPEDFEERMQKAVRFENFKQTGAKIIENIAQGFIGGMTTLGAYMESVRTNPEFIKQTTFSGKVNFVIEDLLAKFNGWYESTGKTILENATNTIMETIASAIEENSGALAGAALTVGSKIGSSIVSGIVSALENNPITKALLGAGAGALIGSAVPGVGTILGGAIGGGASLFQHYSDKLVDFLIPGKTPSKAGGLSRVPYNGYQATLHKDEQVLTAEEAKAYRNGKSGGANVTISGNTFNVRQESDIQKIAYELAKLIEREGVQTA